MRIHVMSDLHFEHYKSTVPFFKELDEFLAKSPSEVLVLAGDIYSTKHFNKLKEALAPFALSPFAARYRHVLYVPGNHESWGTDIHTTNTNIAQLEEELPALQVLRPGSCVEIEGTTFSGGTLWFRDTTDRALKAAWCDYWMIREAEWTIPLEHGAFTRWLENPDCKPDVMVSHHFPTDESIASRWQGQETNVFFCARIDPVIEQMAKRPRVWIHGHTHDPLDYVSKHGFRVYCNPRGYPHENINPNFWDRVAVDV